MAEMRILTVRQPWAWAIIHGGKDIENRVRNIAGKYRGPVAIHAAKINDVEAWQAMGSQNLAAYSAALDARESLIGGAVIGVVDLVGVHDSRLDGCGARKGEASLGDLIPLCSGWAEPWAHHLVLANPRPLATPITYKGALGLRRLDEETTALVLAGAEAYRREETE